MQLHGLLDHAPVFAPSVGYFKRGMLVSVPLHLGSLPRAVSGADLQLIYAEHFAGEPFVTVRPLNDTAALRDNAFLEPEALNGTNRLEVFVFAQRRLRPGDADRATRQPRQGRERRRRAEHQPDAGIAGGRGASP